MKVNGKANLRVVSEVVEAFKGATNTILPTIDPIKCEIVTIEGSDLVDEVTFETDEVPLDLVETVFQAFLMGWTLHLMKMNAEILKKFLG